MWLCPSFLHELLGNSKCCLFPWTSWKENNELQRGGMMQNEMPPHIK